MDGKIPSAPQESISELMAPFDERVRSISPSPSRMGTPDLTAVANGFRNFVIGALRDTGDPLNKMLHASDAQDFVNAVGDSILAVGMGAPGKRSLASVGMKAMKAEGPIGGIFKKPSPEMLEAYAKVKPSLDAISAEAKPSWMQKPGAPKNYAEWIHGQTHNFVASLTHKEWEEYQAATQEWKKLPIAEKTAQVDKYFGKENPLSEADISAALGKNPGASIFDIAGQGSPITKMEMKGPLKEEQLKSPPAPQWGDPGFPWPTGEAAERAKLGGYTTPAWTGMNTGMFRKMREEGYDPEKFVGGYPTELPFRHDRTFFSSSPRVADMYSGYLGDAPENVFMTGSQQSGNLVMPTLLNTEKFPVIDAQGRSYGGMHSPIAREAREKGWPGVVIKNVYDEPAFSRKLGHPSDVTIVFDTGASAARSPQAEFDPKKFHLPNLLAGLGGGAVLPWLGASPDVQR